MAGLQARSAPSVAYVHDLIKQGYIGEVLSTSLISSGMGWGPTVEPFDTYLNDKKNGATMLSIPLGHEADALYQCPGEVRELSATMTVRRKSFTIVGTGERKPMNADDQVLVTDCSIMGPRSRSTIAVAFRAARTCSGRSTAPRAICSSPPPAAKLKSSS